MTHLRVAVIGAGGAGSAAAWMLARAGHAVTCYEQFRAGHDRGSSHGESRIIRYAYPDAFYTGLMRVAYPIWRDLEEQVGEHLYNACGGLTVGHRSCPALRATARALDVAGILYEELEGIAAADRVPAMRLASGEAALLQADGGFLRAQRCVDAMMAQARKCGTTVREECAVDSVTQRGSDVIVGHDGEGDRFDRAIVAAGAWTGVLSPAAGPALTVTRQTVAYLPILACEPEFETPALPVWIDAATNFYGFPKDGVVPGVKVALHQPGRRLPHGPETVERAGPADAAPIAAYAAGRFPGLGAEPVAQLTCLYTSTADEDFILDVMPGSPHIVVVSACSGHGFKFLPLTGRLAAELAVDGAASVDISRFSLARFGPAA